MKSMESILSNPYLDRYITLPRLYNFSVSLKNRLSINNPSGVFDETITMLIDALAPVQNARNAEDSSVGTQKSKTVVVNDLMKDFAKTARNMHRKIAAVFDPGTSEYVTLFPDKLYPFNHLTKKNTPTLMQHMKHFTEQYEAELGAAIVAAFADYPTLWANPRKEQGEAIVKTDSDLAAIRAMRRMLADAAWKATAKVINYYGSNTARSNTYFDESLLFAHHRSSGRKYGKVAAKGTKCIIKKGVTTESHFELMNNGVTNLEYYMAGTPNSNAVGKVFKVLPQEVINTFYKDFDADGCNFLHVRNLGEMDGKWEVVMKKHKAD
ncbi:MAG: hypothetical protein NTX03_14965 [Bacteroidetes bacterium]|nr:hypothetical protein [Bacteroidota bacterium]